MIQIFGPGGLARDGKKTGFAGTKKPQSLGGTEIRFRVNSSGSDL